MKKCSKHKKYKPNKKPSYLCEECLSIYYKFKSHRIPTAPPSKIFKDKTKYNRKSNKNNN